jgi:hypothetical protein
MKNNTTAPNPQDMQSRKDTLKTLNWRFFFAISAIQTDRQKIKAAVAQADAIACCQTGLADQRLLIEQHGICAGT